MVQSKRNLVRVVSRNSQEIPLLSGPNCNLLTGEIQVKITFFTPVAWALLPELTQAFKLNAHNGDGQEWPSYLRRIAKPANNANQPITTPVAGSGTNITHVWSVTVMPAMSKS